MLTVCHKHPDRPATSRIYQGGPELCYECTQEIIRFTAQSRAFGTGCGPEAHAEAQESGAMQQEYDRLKPQKYEILKGGKPV